RAFKRRYNAEYNANLPLDGSITWDTWGAMFDLYMRPLGHRLPQRGQGKTAQGRPLGYAYLFIRRTDSIWPVKMAEIATGNANRYTELNPLNPHLCNSAGRWRDLWAGDQINIPADWVEPLRAAGYDIRVPPPPAPSPDALELMASPGPKATG